VHGVDGLERAERASGVLFGSGPVRELETAELLDVFADVPSTEIARDRLQGEGIPVLDLAVEAGIASSRGEARRLIAAGGVYLNGERLGRSDDRVRVEDTIGGEILLLRKGKKENRLVRLVG
jgi:tyrosyl-tRNA synthetase